MNDKAFRPAIVNTDAGIRKYDEIFICLPIWWYVALTIINTFLEKYYILVVWENGNLFGKER